MLKTYAMIMEELKQYANPKTKLARLVKANMYFPVVKGLYETKADVPGYLLAGSIYGPSYLSFEFALSVHGVIPERVSTFTSATYEKKKRKLYKSRFGIFTYQDVPMRAFPYGVLIKQEGEYFYRLACLEKAICDKLYASPLLRNQQNLVEYLFEDLRIDEYELRQFDMDKTSLLASLYGSNNVRLLEKYIRRLKK